MQLKMVMQKEVTTLVEIQGCFTLQNLKEICQMCSKKCHVSAKYFNIFDPGYCPPIVQPPTQFQAAFHRAPTMICTIVLFHKHSHQNYVVKSIRRCPGTKSEPFF